MTYSDDYAGNSCQIRIAHGKNISFYNTVFQNNYNSHNVEVAACNNVLFKECVFKNASGSLVNNSGEALQIDILEESKHFKAMPEYDGTMNKNITINKCIFSNLLRGLGTNSAFAGLYHKGITVTNCLFENILSSAITCSNYIDSKISNNTITNCGTGIEYFLMKDDNNLHKMNYIEGKGAPVSDCNTLISENSISIIKTKGVSYAVGLHIFGNNITKSKKVSFTKGNYFVGKIKIKNNNIKSDNYGIRLFDVRNSLLSGNIVNGKSNNSGILLDSHTRANKLYGNTVKTFDKGIYLKSGNDNIIKSNILENNHWGIFFSSGLKECIHYNRFESNRTSAFSEGEGESESFTFSNLAMPRIKVTKKKTTATIKWKKIKNAQYYQVFRATSKNGKFKKIANLKPTSISFKDKKLKKGKTYYYKVRAKRKLNGVTNYSSFSSVNSVKI